MIRSFLRSKVKIIYSVVFPYKNPYVHCFSANMSQINMYKDCDSMNVSYFSQNLHPYDFIVSNLSSYISLLAKQVNNGCVWVTDRENLLKSSSFKFSWQLWIIAGKATHALRCVRTIAGELLQLFSVISDIVINKSKICCKSDSVARVKNWIGENISRPPGQINPMKSFLQETCRVASELFSPIQFFTLALSHSCSKSCSC